MKTATVYITDDGDRFDDEAEALAHEATLGHEGRAAAYVSHAHPDQQGKARSHKINTIVGFLEFEQGLAEAQTTQEESENVLNLA